MNPPRRQAPPSARAILLWFGAALLAAFILSVVWIIQLRVEARQLTAQRGDLLKEARRLEDASRNLMLEYHTFADYDKIRMQAARRLDMTEPSLADGTLVYLSAAEGE